MKSKEPTKFEGVEDQYACDDVIIVNPIVIIPDDDDTVSLTSSVVEDLLWDIEEEPIYPIDEVIDLTADTDGEEEDCYIIEPEML